jgi:hypothetical protein
MGQCEEELASEDQPGCDCITQVLIESIACRFSPGDRLIEEVSKVFHIKL